MRKLKYLSAVLLSAIALTACEDDLAVINPDPGQPSTVPDAINDTESILMAESCPNTDAVFHDFAAGNAPATITDHVVLKLQTSPEKDVTYRIGMNPAYVDWTSNDRHSMEYPSKVIGDFCNMRHLNVNTTSFGIGNQSLKDHLLLNGNHEAFITLKAGEKESASVEVLFRTNNLHRGQSYLFPIQVTDVESGELITETFFLVTSLNLDTEPIGKKPAVFIAYLDTEVMNPLIGNKFIYTLTYDDYNTGESTIIYRGRAFDILNIRTSTLKDVDGNPQLTLTSDLQYVLKKHSKYLEPLQQSGMKVCLVVKGGGTGLGFSNMTDKQITYFVAQLKTTVEMNGLDGVNLWDEGAGYDKDGATPITAESYAKLIKAIKTAMPDKLLTLVDTRETTDALCDPAAGISVGDYIDYAWSSLEDFLAPYEPDATLRPLAGLQENRYGTIFVRDEYTMTQEEKDKIYSNPLIDSYMNMMRFTPLSGTDIFVYGDITYKDYSNEGIWTSPAIYWEVSHFPYPEDFSYGYSGICDWPNYMNFYNTFKKDW